MEGKTKAEWDKKNTYIFCDICIETIHNGMRHSTHFNARGWKFLVSEFQSKTNLKYEKIQLKNKWNQLKNTWKTWRQLIEKETGLGWNPYKGTIDADEEWWVQKIQVDSSFAKFKKKEIEHELSSKYEIMFGDILATGDYAWAPSHIKVQENLSSRDIPFIDDTINLEPAGDSNYEELDKTLDDILAGDPQENFGRKEKQKIYYESPCGKAPKRVKLPTRKTGTAIELRENIKSLVQSVHSRTSATSRLVDPPGTSMGEVIADLKKILELKVDRRLYLFAIDLLEEKIKREAYVALETVEEKMEWLQHKFNKANQV